MKLKKMNRIIMVLLLFTLILGQSSLAFAGKPGGGTTTYVPPTITQGDVLNLAVEDGKSLNITLSATGTNFTTFTWSNTTTTNASITKSNTTLAYGNSQVTFTYLNNKPVTSDTFTVRVTDVKKKNTFDTIRINVTITKPLDFQAPENVGRPTISGTFYPDELLTANPGTWTDASLPLTYNYQWLINGNVISTSADFTPTIDMVGKNVTLSVQAVDTAKNVSARVTSFEYVIIEKPVQTVFNYVALGDSIPAGVSYENSTTQKIITSYTDQIATDLHNSYDVVNYYDLAVSGLNIYKAGDIGPYDSLYSQVFFDQSIRDSISTANLITLCIGANDIMDAAPRNLTGGAVNFYDINWAVADQGLDNFYAYWDDIISEIYALAPDNVNIVVMNMYNPYRISDSETNKSLHDVYPNASMHTLVNKYFYSTEDLNPSAGDGIDYGLNFIIENPQIVYANQLQENGLPLGFEKPYQVVNVYDEFEKDQSSKSNWIAFYDNSGYAYIDFFGILIPVLVPVQDPHPTVAGQAVLFDLHKSVIAW